MYPFLYNGFLLEENITDMIEKSVLLLVPLYLPVTLSSAFMRVFEN